MPPPMEINAIAATRIHPNAGSGFRVFGGVTCGDGAPRGRAIRLRAIPAPSAAYIAQDVAPAVLDELTGRAQRQSRQDDRPDEDRGRPRIVLFVEAVHRLMKK